MSRNQLDSKPNPPPLDSTLWIAAQAHSAPQLAQAALQVGRLDATLAALPPARADGARHRLALTEIESMLWAQGTPIRREDIGRDLIGARSGSDLEAMRLARWAIRRLDGQATLNDLRGFLGLHRRDAPETEFSPRPTGGDFDETATEFLHEAARFDALHPFARAPALRILWRLAGLSHPDQQAEAAIWTARAMATDCEALRFLPLGRHWRMVWTDSGAAADRLARHLDAVAMGAVDARQLVGRITGWMTRAEAATTGIKGDNPARVIAMLATHPLVSAPMIEDGAGISRITAERLLNRMTEMGLVRELTGARRFRLWCAPV